MNTCTRALAWPAKSKFLSLRSLGTTLFAAIIGLASAGSASAGPILSAVGGTINSGGPGFGTLTETFNQAGLSVGYTSGVTDFDTYIASDPRHTAVFRGYEWFSESGTTSASVTYDLGSVVGIDALALWNEESAGIGILDLWGSTDGSTFFSLASGLNPIDNPVNNVPDYGAEVFSFAAASLRYFRMDMSACPQADPATFSGCSIGEVAFRGAEVPEPTTLAILGLGLAGLGFMRRRKA